MFFMNMLNSTFASFGAHHKMKSITPIMLRKNFHTAIAFLTCTLVRIFIEFSHNYIEFSQIFHNFQLGNC